MDPNRKRSIRLSVALTAALLLATALIYVSFTAGRDEVTAQQYLRDARAGDSFALAGTVVNGSIHQLSPNTISFKVFDPGSRKAVTVRYTGITPDAFAQGRAVMVNVTDRGGLAVGQSGSLTTKCPSKYQAASGADS